VIGGGGIGCDPDLYEKVESEIWKKGEVNADQRRCIAGVEQAKKVPEKKIYLDFNHKSGRETRLSGKVVGGTIWNPGEKPYVNRGGGNVCPFPEPGVT